MIYHGLNDKRLKTVTFPFEDGSHPTYYIPAEASDLINNSTVAGATVKEALETIDGKTLATLTQRSAKPGSIVTFEDGADDIPLRHLEFDVECTQDLHGYDNPWPGGGGKNLIPYPYVTTGSTWNGMTITESGGKVTIKGTQSGVSPFVFANGVAIKGGVTYTINPNVTGSGGIFFTIYDFNTSTVLANTSINPATFTPTEDHTVMIYLNPSSGAQGSSFDFSIQPQLEVGSTATEWSPYENICPITGYTGAEVSVTGKNLLDTSTVTSGTITYIQSVDGYVVSSSSSDTRAWSYVNSQYKTTLPAGTYKFVWDVKTPSTNAGRGYRVYTDDGTILANGYTTALDTSGESVTFTLSKATNIGVMIKQFEMVARFMIVSSSESNDYEPFGHTYSISFPSSAGTISSGHVTIEKDGSGTLVVDRTEETFDGSQDESIQYGSSGMTFLLKVKGDIKESTSQTSVSGIISNYLKEVIQAGTWGVNGTFSRVTQNKDRIYIKINDTLTDVNEFKTYLSSNPLSFVYELATPITYTLDPVQVKSLLGLNNVWVNTGDITGLTYYVGGEYKDAEDKRDIIEATIPYDTASGAIATFPDGADNVRLKQLSIDINPVQDLHGYDNPWPAGGGKNLIDPSIFGTFPHTINGVTGTLNADGTISLSGTATSRIYFPVIDYKLLSAYGFFEAGTTYKLSGFGTSSVYCIFGIRGSGTDYSASTESGSDMTFTAEQLASLEYRLIINIANGTNTNGIIIKPMICLASATNPAVFAPYSNICPISGHTECNVTRTGKNLLLVENEPQSASGCNVTKNADGSYTFATPSGLSAVYYWGIYGVYSGKGIPLKAGQKYLIKDVNVQINGVSRGTQQTPILYTAQEGDYINYLWFRFATDMLPSGTSQTLYPMIQEATSLDDSFVSYVDNVTIPITFPSGTGTVYGGNVTVNRDGSGELVLDWKSKSLNGSEIWTAYPNHETEWAYCSAFSSNEVYPDPLNSIYRKSNFLASVDNIVMITDTKAAFSFSPVSNRSNMYVHYPSFITSTQAWKEYLANNNLQVVYKLAVPLATIPLTAPQITTLLGTNNIWSDTNGDVSANYPCDVGLFITKKLEELVGDNG